MVDTRDTRKQPGSWPNQTPWLCEKDEQGRDISEVRECDNGHGPYMARLYAGVPHTGERAKGPMADALKPFLKPWWSRCPTCNAEIAEEQERSRAEILYGESEKLRLRKQKALEAGIPERYLDVEPFEKMEDFLPAQRKAMNVVRNYCREWPTQRKLGRCMVLTGVPGTGKTFAAAAVANYVIAQGGDAHYTTAEGIAENIRSSYSEKGSTERKVLEAFVAPDLLVIDEVGRMNSTDLASVKLQRVIDERYNRRHPTIVASNLSKDQLRASLGNAMFDRLRDNQGIMLRFSWESLRGREEM